jgi:hypothetical protein
MAAETPARSRTCIARSLIWQLELCSIPHLAGLLKDADWRAAKWQRKAAEFADDSEALQGRLQQVNEQQRSSVRSVYSELERRIGGESGSKRTATDWSGRTDWNGLERVGTG